MTGNYGNNIFQGYSGDDRIDGRDGIDRAIYIGYRDDYVILPPYVSDDSSYQILDLIPDRDGRDNLWNIEEISFNSVIFQIDELLEKDTNPVPYKFALFSPYPNPFNPKTRISFSTEKYGKIEVLEHWKIP